LEEIQLLPLQTTSLWSKKIKIELDDLPSRERKRSK
jgi:hypothetical protein